jgi:hypothetical protein
LRLKLENQIPNSDVHRKEPLIIEISDNETLWTLKRRLAPIYGLHPTKLDVVKYVNPIDDSNLGKTLSDLFFFN